MSARREIPQLLLKWKLKWVDKMTAGKVELQWGFQPDVIDISAHWKFTVANQYLPSCAGGAPIPTQPYDIW